ncbi:MAG: ABC transporter permease [Thermomicrobiales bacterium]|nr:ABC transporter permease [Thermomicrobiales bacterium]
MSLQFMAERGHTEMTLDAQQRAGAAENQLARAQRWRRVQRFWTSLVRQRNIMVGGALLLLVICCAVFASILATHNPQQIEVLSRLQPPSAEFFFGTDQQGRDVYSRVLYGARLSLSVGFTVALATVVLGTLIGLVAGFYNRADAVIMRVMDGMMAFPSIILAIGIMAARGASSANVVLALTIVGIPGLVRLVRSVVLSMRETQFVEAAQAVGNPDWRILWRHILPNTFSPLIVQTTYIFAVAVLSEATLSFLGAGAPPEEPSWGVMLNDARSVLQQAPWAVFFPGAAITLTVFSLNLLGDGLRDMLDPQLRQR